MTHLHHAWEQGLQLPSNFDMDTYMLLSRQDKIQYAKQHVPRETIISYQNMIGKRMSLVFGTGVKTYSFPATAGKYKANVSLVIQTIPNSERLWLTIVNEKGVQVTTFTHSRPQFMRNLENDFWVLPDTNFN